MVKQVLAHPSWHDIEKGVAIIARQAQKAGAGIDKVIGLTRGGLIPGVLFSHIWEVPMVSASYSSLDGAGNNKNHDNILPTIYGADIPSGQGIAPAVPSLLIIDDICDTGKTMSEVFLHYQRQGHVVWTAALYHKENAVLVPDFVWQTLSPLAPWIEFPWEME